MARARNLKPDFFRNDILAQCTPHARLLFAGLWCLADREGRLEDRPVRIMGELFPYEHLNIEGLLKELCEHGFVLRYEADKRKYIQVVNFNKHQNPHVKEHPSTIPAPCGYGASPASSLLPLSDSPSPQRGAPEAVLPDWLNKDAWTEWKKYRSQIRKAMTSLTVTRQLKLLEEHKADHVAIIQQSITAGWTGLFPLKGNGQRQVQKGNGSHEDGDTRRKREALRLAQVEQRRCKLPQQAPGESDEAFIARVNRDSAPPGPKSTAPQARAT